MVVSLKIRRCRGLMQGISSKRASGIYSPTQVSRRFSPTMKINAYTEAKKDATVQIRTIKNLF